MTNGTQETRKPETLERNVDDTFLLTYDNGTRTALIHTDEGDVEDAIAYVAAFLQVNHTWAQHVTCPDLWIAIGIEE